MIPTIRMLRSTDDPPRKAGQLYAVKDGEGWPLVRDGFAEWEYVPEADQDALPHAESAAPKKRKAK